MQNLNKANRCSYRQIQTYNIFLLLKKKKIVSRILKKKKKITANKYFLTI